MLGGHQSCSGCGDKEKNPSPRTPIVQPVAQHYTD